MALRLSLFGAPAVTYGDVSRALDFERRGQLLAFLALRRAWVGRAEIAALLWPDQASKLAYTNLRKALFRLSSLPWAERVESDGNALRFDVATDVAEFEAALQERRFTDALDLRRGELLAGFDDDANDAWSSWLGYERERLRVAWSTAAREVLAGDIDAHMAVDLAGRLLEAEPLDESALAAYMSWLARSGQGARARQAYRDFSKRLQDELGLSPGAELRALHDSIGAIPLPTRSAAPAVRTRSDDDFVGRAVELRRITALLGEEGCRLLTLIGPGGVGKTRLARRVIAEVGPTFADGAVYVPLEDISTAPELANRLAHELDVQSKGGDPLDAVIAHLRERRMLLVLDNFEQLVEAASLVDHLLASCPGVKALATSRVRLTLAGEWMLPLEGLPCPEMEDLDHLESFDAARLFVRAARRVAPALVPAVEASAIVDICRQVEGLPLALELAAAWTRALSCAEIAAELRRGTELLTTVDRTQPARHASVELVFEQSWQLLTAGEREVLARLSVFRGGFTTEAARAVARAPLPVLAALVDKSLLRKEGERTFLHPLVQQFAAARLEAGDRRATEERHARYFHDLMHQMRRPVENGDRDALKRFDDEFENLRAAWRWAAARPAIELLARSVYALSHYCDHRSRLDEGLQLLHDTLDSPAAVGDAGLKALLLGRAALLEYRQDRYADARVTAERGLELLASAHETDSDARTQCLKVIGNCHLRLGELPAARHHFEQALKLAPACSDIRLRSAMVSSLALVEKMSGNYDEARRLSIEALEQQRRLGDVAGEALSLNNLAALLLERQEFQAAGEYLKPALVLCDLHGLATTRGFVLTNLAGVEMKLGRLEAAEGYAKRALEHAQGIANRFVVSFLKLQFTRFALARGELEVARAELAAGMELAIAIGRPTLLIEGILCFGEILARQGEVACAHSVLDFALAHPITGAVERDELVRAAARLPAADRRLPWPGLSLDELAHRIVAERDVAYAPLVAALRGGSLSPVGATA
jgi:predicted ATPase/DNA-binding SARP family transcriptional activator/Tfp pilus assembly protein PilF